MGLGLLGRNTTSLRYPFQPLLLHLRVKPVFDRDGVLADEDLGKFWPLFPVELHVVVDDFVIALVKSDHFCARILCTFGLLFYQLSDGFPRFEVVPRLIPGLVRLFGVSDQVFEFNARIVFRAKVGHVLRADQVFQAGASIYKLVV